MNNSPSCEKHVWGITTCTFHTGIMGLFRAHIHIQVRFISVSGKRPSSDPTRLLSATHLTQNPARRRCKYFKDSPRYHESSPSIHLRINALGAIVTSKSGLVLSHLRNCSSYTGHRARTIQFSIMSTKSTALYCWKCFCVGQSICVRQIWMRTGCIHRQATEEAYCLGTAVDKRALWRIAWLVTRESKDVNKKCAQLCNAPSVLMHL